MKLVFVLVSRVVKLLALAAIVPSYGMQAMAITYQIQAFAIG